MSSFLAVFGRELRAYFVSPLAWVILTFFLFGQGIVFYLVLGYLADPRSAPGVTPFDFFFNSFFFWIFLLFLTPVATMRLIAEERRSGTIESLMTAPITEARVVLAKYFAALVFYAFLWAPTLLYPALISRYTTIDWGPVAAGYLGVLGIGAMALAIGLCASSFVKNQIVAAIAAFGLVLVLFVVPWLAELLSDPTWVDILGLMNLAGHMEEFSQGIVDTRRLVYYASTAALFLFFTTRSLEAKKWR